MQSRVWEPSVIFIFLKEIHCKKQNNIGLPEQVRKLRVWLESLSWRFPHGVLGSAWVVLHCLQIVPLYCLHYHCKPHLHLHFPLQHHCCCLLMAQGCQDLFHAYQTVSQCLDILTFNCFTVKPRQFCNSSSYVWLGEKMLVSFPRCL